MRSLYDELSSYNRDRTYCGRTGVAHSRTPDDNDVPRHLRYRDAIIPFTVANIYVVVVTVTYAYDVNNLLGTPHRLRSAQT